MTNDIDAPALPQGGAPNAGEPLHEGGPPQDRLPRRPQRRADLHGRRRGGTRGPSLEPSPPPARIPVRAPWVVLCGCRWGFAVVSLVCDVRGVACVWYRSEVVVVVSCDVSPCLRGNHGDIVSVCACVLWVLELILVSPCSS